MSTMKTLLRVNNTTHELTIDARVTLLDALRDGLGLTVEAEHFLAGRAASDETFREAAEIALNGAVAREHNHFKIELAKRTIVRACAATRDNGRRLS